MRWVFAWAGTRSLRSAALVSGRSWLYFCSVGGKETMSSIIIYANGLTIDTYWAVNPDGVSPFVPSLSTLASLPSAGWAPHPHPTCACSGSLSSSGDALLLFVGDQALTFCKTPTDHYDCSICCQNKDELNEILNVSHSHLFCNVACSTARYSLPAFSDL